MSYFADLSVYRYLNDGVREGTLNIGWLAAGCEFSKAVPAEGLLDFVWEYCKFTVAQTRGIHLCELCSPPKMVLASRKDMDSRLLGTSEIRVFGTNGRIYAAPTLIYHYIRSHHYKPPDEFIDALRSEPSPLSAEYRARLSGLNFGWKELSARSSSAAFCFEIVGEKIEKVAVATPTHVDQD